MGLLVLVSWASEESMGVYSRKCCVRLAFFFRECQGWKVGLGRRQAKVGC